MAGGFSGPLLETSGIFFIYLFFSVQTSQRVNWNYLFHAEFVFQPVRKIMHADRLLNGPRFYDIGSIQ